MEWERPDQGTLDAAERTEPNRGLALMVNEVGVLVLDEQSRTAGQVVVLLLGSCAY